MSRQRINHLPIYTPEWLNVYISYLSLIDLYRFIYIIIQVIQCKIDMYFQRAINIHVSRIHYFDGRK